MSKQQSIEKILNKLTKDELKGILLELAKQDEHLRNALLLQYGEGNNEQRLASYSKLIQSTVRRYAGRDGFIPYRETHRFAIEMLELLENFNAANDERLELEAALMILAEAIEAFQYADDSNGDIGILVDSALERIFMLTCSLNKQDLALHQYYMNRLLAVSTSGIFQGWDEFQIALFRICSKLSETEELREQLKAAIELQIDASATQTYGAYTQEALLMILYELIEAYGTSEEAELFIANHLLFPAFRALQISRRMESGDYTAVIELAKEGEQQDKGFPGLVIKWKNARYEAYKQLNLKQEQWLLAKELLLTGDYKYYQELESLNEEDELVFYRSMLAELKKVKGWGVREIYLKLISDKNDVEEMMSYVRSSPSSIESYAARLMDRYPEEVEQIYREFIDQLAETSSNRKDYKRVCKVIRQYGKTVGKDKQAAVIDKFTTQYARRPAFIDELENLR